MSPFWSDMSKSGKYVGLWLVKFLVLDFFSVFSHANTKTTPYELTVHNESMTKPIFYVDF